MDHELSISFPGRSDPIPGAIPEAAAALLRARDHGETAWPDAPRDGTAVEAIARTADRLRESFSSLVVVGAEADTAGIHALAAAYASGDGIPVVPAAPANVTSSTDAFLFVAKAREPGGEFAAYEPVRERIREQSGAAWRDRVVIITDPARGDLREEAARTGVATFTYPISVEGLDSLLTPVGLLPAAVAGGDPVGILAAATVAQDRVDGAPFETNPAWRLAAALAERSGWRVPEPDPAPLRAAAAWLRRLLASRLGGAESPDGVPVHLDPDGAPESGIVVRSGGSPAALIQLLLNGVVLAAGGAA